VNVTLAAPVRLTVSFAGTRGPLRR